LLDNNETPLFVSYYILFMIGRQFMRGTDPTKSTWVYPKFIL